MKKLPNPLLQTVISKLKNKDLSNLCLANQQTYKICTLDESFRLIISGQYPGLVEKKPVKMTWMDWYKKNLNSGSLFIKNKLIAKNVCYAFDLDYSGGIPTVVYLTLQGDLYLYGSYGEILEDYAFGFLSDDLKNTLLDNLPDQSLLLATGIDDFSFVNGGYSLILDKGGKLYLSNGTSSDLIGTNFREILIRAANMYFVVRNWDNIVYTLDTHSVDIFDNKIDIKLEELDSGIIYVVDMRYEMGTIFIAVKQDGGLYCYAKSWIKTITSSSNPKKRYAPHYIQHTNKFKLFDAGVKEVTLGDTKVITLDTSGYIRESTLPTLSDFPFITNDNEPDVEDDHNPILTEYTFRKVASNPIFLITTDSTVYDINKKKIVDFGLEKVIDVIQERPRIVILKQT